MNNRSSRGWRKAVTAMSCVESRLKMMPCDQKTRSYEMILQVQAAAVVGGDRGTVAMTQTRGQQPVNILTRTPLWLTYGKSIQKLAQCKTKTQAAVKPSVIAMPWNCIRRSAMSRYLSTTPCVSPRTLWMTATSAGCCTGSSSGRRWEDQRNSTLN